MPPAKKWPHVAEWARQDAIEGLEVIATRAFRLTESESDPAKLRELNAIQRDAYEAIRKLEKVKNGRE
jgi:hypothetical protein